MGALDAKTSQVVVFNEVYCVAKDGSGIHGEAHVTDDFMVDPSDASHVIVPPSINGTTIEDAA